MISKIETTPERLHLNGFYPINHTKRNNTQIIFSKNQEEIYLSTYKSTSIPVLHSEKSVYIDHFLLTATNDCLSTN